VSTFGKFEHLREADGPASRILDRVVDQGPTDLTDPDDIPPSCRRCAHCGRGGVVNIVALPAGIVRQLHRECEAAWFAASWNVAPTKHSRTLLPVLLTAQLRYLFIASIITMMRRAEPYRRISHKICARCRAFVGLCRCAKVSASLERVVGTASQIVAVISVGRRGVRGKTTGQRQPARAEVDRVGAPSCF
jgi:hypothetical protein